MLGDGSAELRGFGCGISEALACRCCFLWGRQPGCFLQVLLEVMCHHQIPLMAEGGLLFPTCLISQLCTPLCAAFQSQVPMALLVCTPPLCHPDVKAPSRSLLAPSVPPPCFPQLHRVSPWPSLYFLLSHGPVSTSPRSPTFSMPPSCVTSCWCCADLSAHPHVPPPGIDAVSVLCHLLPSAERAAGPRSPSERT